MKTVRNSLNAMFFAAVAAMSLQPINAMQNSTHICNNTSQLDFASTNVSQSEHQKFDYVNK